MELLRARILQNDHALAKCLLTANSMRQFWRASNPHDTTKMLLVDLSMALMEMQIACIRLQYDSADIRNTVEKYLYNLRKVFLIVNQPALQPPEHWNGLDFRPYMLHMKELVPLLERIKRSLH